jgi:hypothetical protein
MKFQIRPSRLRADFNYDFAAFLGCVLASVLVFAALVVADNRHNPSTTCDGSTLGATAVM